MSALPDSAVSDHGPGHGPDHGMVHLSSSHSVADTLAKLEEMLRTRGISIFACIDHSGEAAKVGLEMRPTKVLIFGSPKAGTPVMIASPTVAIDLPLKALVWEDGEGKVWLSYNSPEYLQRRHGFPASLIQNIAGVRSIFDEAIQ